MNRIGWIAELPIDGSIRAKNVDSHSRHAPDAHKLAKLCSVNRSGALFAPGTCQENVAAARPSNLARLHVIDEPEVTNILQESRKFNWRDKSHGGNVGAPSQSL